MSDVSHDMIIWKDKKIASRSHRASVSALKTNHRLHQCMQSTGEGEVPIRVTSEYIQLLSISVYPFIIHTYVSIRPSIYLPIQLSIIHAYLSTYLSIYNSYQGQFQCFIYYGSMGCVNNVLIMLYKHLMWQFMN